MCNISEMFLSLSLSLSIITTSITLYIIHIEEKLSFYLPILIIQVLCYYLNTRFKIMDG